MRGAGWIIVASAVLLVVGLGRMLWERRWLRAFIVVTAVAAFPLLMMAVKGIENEHLRFWVGMLVASLTPAWLLIGFFVDAVNRGDWPVFAEPKSTLRRRISGGALAAVGAVLWAYGATHPDMTKVEGVLVLMASLYSLAIGLYWLSTGKRFSD